jgi:hypothetical protein
MKRRDPGLGPELEAFLKPRMIQRRVPPEIRARALAGARAILAAGGAIPRSARHELPTVPVRSARARGPVRLALAGAVAIAVGAVGAVGALRGRVAHPPQTGLLASPRQPVPAVRDASFGGVPREPPPAAAPHAPTAKPTRPARASGAADAVAAELDLLQRAHGAYTRRDFSTALALIAEHARRFPKGHLAEQREALRVRSLMGSGHVDQADRAAAAFTVHFPRSVLLPHVEESPEALHP